MNHGIADAVTLVKELTAASKGEQGQKEAVDAFQKEMITRAGEEVQMSIGNTEMLHDWNRFQEAPLLVKGGNPNVKKT
jgi:2-polyprenyl-6-methoxyphenol hydroxylase-like FAD-dependent oxidoreductase